MHGDYSRGHEPDSKRGRDYRRVLLQMGRPVLDSDVAATVDAVLGQVRAATRGLGCAAGSPDLGFLVTPGRLLCVPAEAAASLTATGTPDVWLDYRHRFAGRYPALHVAAGGAQTRVTLPLLQRPDPAGPPRAALWARVEAPTAVSINGAAVPLAPSGGPQRFEFAIGASLDPLQLILDAGERGLAVPARAGRARGGAGRVLDRPGQLSRRRAGRGRPRRRSVPGGDVPHGRRIRLGREPGPRAARWPRPGRPERRDATGRLPRDLGAARHRDRGPGDPRGGARHDRHLHAHRAARPGQARHAGRRAPARTGRRADPARRVRHRHRLGRRARRRGARDDADHRPVRAARAGRLLGQRQPALPRRGASRRRALGPAPEVVARQRLRALRGGRATRAASSSSPPSRRRRRATSSRSSATSSTSATTRWA